MVDDTLFGSKPVAQQHVVKQSARAGVVIQAQLALCNYGVVPMCSLCKYCVNTMLQWDQATPF